MLLSSDLRPSGLVNTIRGPKKVILVALGDGWVEQSHLGVCSPSENYLGSKLFFYLSVILFYTCICFV